MSAGTAFTSPSGKVFYSTSSVSVGGYSGGTSQAPACQSSGARGGTGSVSVQAASAGDSFNISATQYTIGGVSGFVYANGGAMTGGTTKVVKVVTEADVEKAREKLSEESADAKKAALLKKFTKDQVVITESFKATKTDAVASPAVGKEAPDGKAKLTAMTQFTMQAVLKSELDDYLKEYMQANLDNKETQKVYSTGIDSVSFTNFLQDNDTSTVTVVAKGGVGPRIDEDRIKENAKGERYGEIQQRLQAIDGVKEVDVKFSYFWVTRVPNNTDKIKIEFKVNENDR